MNANRNLANRMIFNYTSKRKNARQPIDKADIIRIATDKHTGAVKGTLISKN